MSIICPNCNFEEPEGAIFCSECGTKLIKSDGLSTASIRATDAKLADPSTDHTPILIYPPMMPTRRESPGCMPLLE